MAAADSSQPPPSGIPPPTPMSKLRTMPWSSTQRVCAVARGSGKIIARRNRWRTACCDAPEPRGECVPRRVTRIARRTKARVL